MFNSKDSRNLTAEPGSITTLGTGTVVKGDMLCKGDIRLDGTLIGNLECGSKVILGPKGMIEGHIKGNHADIMGRVNGNINMAGQLNLMGNAIVQGDIHTAKLLIESSAQFNGKCSMGSIQPEDKRHEEQ